MKKLLVILFCIPLLVAGQYEAGQTYFGTNNYTEYNAGSLPIIILAPHGGKLKPDSIPDRDCDDCVIREDLNTQEVARLIDSALFNLTGCHPHVVINKLHRSKLDANREVIEATDSTISSEIYWNDFHSFAESAKATVAKNFGKGLIIDLHGHGHPNQRLEIGYLLSKTKIQSSDSLLNTLTYFTGFKNLLGSNLAKAKLAGLVRGDNSLGELYVQEGIPATPSKTDPFPINDEAYFQGGYDVKRHGSRDSGTVDAIQIECNYTGVRDNFTNRKKFAEATARILKKYILTYYLVEDICQPKIPPIKIEGIMINGCGNEANNEYLIFKTTNKTISIDSLKLQTTSRELKAIQNSLTVSFTNYLNQILPKGSTGKFIEPNHTIPANSTVLYFTSASQNNFEYSTLPILKEDTYVIYSSPSFLPIFQNHDEQTREVKITDGKFFNLIEYTSPSFELAKDGDYLMFDSLGSQTQINGCTLHLKEIESLPTGITITENNLIKVFPNPTDGNITITGVDIKQIEVINSLGKNVLSSKSNQIDLSSLTKGYYILKIIDSSNTTSFKKIILI